jgi:hypothetical protein
MAALSCVGGTAGIGKETVRLLAAWNATVIFTGRDTAKGLRVLADIKNTTGSDKVEVSSSLLKPIGGVGAFHDVLFPCVGGGSSSPWTSRALPRSRHSLSRSWTRTPSSTSSSTTVRFARMIEHRLRAVKVLNKPCPCTGPLLCWAPHVGRGLAAGMIANSKVITEDGFELTYQVRGSETTAWSHPCA